MGYLVAHHLGDLVVGRVQLYDKTRVDGHLAPGHAEGIHGLGIVNDLDPPLPVFRFRSKLYRLRDE